MKIAFFSNCYLPYVSGITISIKTLREALESLGHEVYVVGPKYPGQKETDPHVLQFPSIPAPYPGYRFVFPFSVSVFNRLNKIKIDLVHAHQPFGVGLAAFLFARSKKLPLVYTFHTLFPRYVHNIPFVPSFISKIITVRYLRFFCNQTDTIIAPSAMVKRYLRVMKVKKPIKVIPTGVSLYPSPPNLPLPMGEGGGKIMRSGVRDKILLYSGRLSAEKNIPFLLHSFPSVLAAVPNTYLVLCGGGPKEPEYRKAAQNISERIIFTGPIPHEELCNYYSAADLFVYPSISETQGLVLCEAKACGLPIVALFGGGLADVVREGIDGYLVPRKREKFVEHVVRLLQNDALRAEMSAKAREDAQERFASIAVAKEMETLYNSLIEHLSCGEAHI